MTDEMLNAMEKAYKMGCDEAREICNNYKIRIEKLEAALREIGDCCTLPAQNDFEMREIARKALEGKDAE